MPSPLQLLTLLAIALGPCAAAGVVNERALELAAIQAFEEEITVDPFGITANWNGDDFCYFTGFFCEVDNFGLNTSAAIDFNGFGLQGDNLVLEGFIDELTEVAIFHANSNGFTGGIPDLSALSYLYELDLSNNLLSGPFPTGVLSVTYMSFLDLRYNSFYGKIPREVFQYKELEVLFLNNNLFTGSIPDNIGHSTVTYLTLANNQLSGTIPSAIGDMANLQEVLLLNNQLEGSIPEEISYIFNLTVFDASWNYLTGGIPEAICEMPTLEIFNVSGNFLSGSLCPSCKSLIDIGILDISRNCFDDEDNQTPTEVCNAVLG